MHTVNLVEKFRQFNDYCHPRGTLRMRFRDREAIVREGEFVIVPHGGEHIPVADEEVHIILLEPKTTLNTGNVTNERTVRQLEHI